MEIAEEVCYAGGECSFWVPLCLTIKLFPQVKSLLDPCGDENDDTDDGDVSLGDDSGEGAEYSDTENEVMCQHYYYCILR